MDKDAAIQKIIELAQSLNAQLDENQLNFHATKLVLDVLDYIHDDKFPETLCYTLAGLLAKNISAADTADAGGAPLKKITQDDTSFEWAVAEVDTTLDVAAQIFNNIKVRLNLYRKVVGL